jgi:hypothetical protein
MNKVRRNLDQRFEYKSSLVQARMRQSQKLCFLFQVAIKQQVKI